MIAPQFRLGLREMAFVPRWGIARVTRKPSVAEHSYYVAQYADAIADIVEYEGDRAALLRWALWHDADEIVTGDIPGPIKRALRTEFTADLSLSMYVDDLMSKHFGPKGQAITNPSLWDAKATKIIKMADMLDDCMFLCEQTRGGNTWVERVYDQVRHRLFRSVIDMRLSSKTEAALREELALALNDALAGQPVIPE